MSDGIPFEETAPEQPRIHARTSPAMTTRYQHVVPELVEEANRRMSELLWGETAKHIR